MCLKWIPWQHDVMQKPPNHSNFLNYNQVELLRNSTCYEILLSNFWKHKMIWVFYHLESEQWTVYIRWQVTGGEEILCRVCREEQKMPRYSNACREEKKLARNSKKRRNRGQMWSPDPLYTRRTDLTLLSLSALSRAPPFLYCQTVARSSCLV